MKNIKFTVYDPVTGEIRRCGVCAAHLVGKFIRPGEKHIEGERGDILAHEVVEVNGKPSLRHRAQADIVARRDKARAPQLTLSRVLRVLEKKHGIVITRGDLSQA